MHCITNLHTSYYDLAHKHTHMHASVHTRIQTHTHIHTRTHTCAYRRQAIASLQQHYDGGQALAIQKRRNTKE